MKYEKYQDVSGRYLNLDMLESFLQKLSKRKFKIESAGYSVEDRVVYQIKFGAGCKRVLMWSQMHGNESTTTKGLIDWLCELEKNDAYFDSLTSQFSICVLPMLNPDGSDKYTRVNANGVDLNRDANEITQPESQILRKVFECFKPDLALNLHDQRTVFGVGESDKPATMSFLAPSFNSERANNKVRETAMQLIACVNKMLQTFIPGQVARYDDGFNINCIGDYMMSQNVPVILYEAGHFLNDYEREETRKLVFCSIKEVLDSFVSGRYKNESEFTYFAIPENKKTFADLVIVDFDYCLEGLQKNNVIYIRYNEVLCNNEIIFVPEVVVEGVDELRYFYRTVSAKHTRFSSKEDIFTFLSTN